RLHSYGVHNADYRVADRSRVHHLGFGGPEHRERRAELVRGIAAVRLAPQEYTARALLGRNLRQHVHGMRVNHIEAVGDLAGDVDDAVVVADRNPLGLRPDGHGRAHGATGQIDGRQLADVLARDVQDLAVM